MDDLEWLITLRVASAGSDKQVKLKFKNKHISVHSSKPLFPRKGENKPDIEQNVQGGGIWFLVKDVPQVSIPQKGDIKFDVVCDNKVIYRVSGAYELPYISGVRNINWHAEKHITRQKDNVLIRIENPNKVAKKVVNTATTPNSGTKKILEFKTPTSTNKPTKTATTSAKKKTEPEEVEKKEVKGVKEKKEEKDGSTQEKKEASGSKKVKKQEKESESEDKEEEDKKTPSTKSDKIKSPSSSLASQFAKKLNPSISLIAKSPSSFISSSEKKSLKKSLSELSSSPSPIPTKQKSPRPTSPTASAGYTTPTKDGKNLADIDVSPIRPFSIPPRPPQVAFKTPASKLKPIPSPISSSQEDLFTPSPILSDSPVISSPIITDSPVISDPIPPPPPLKRTPSKATPSPKVKKDKALMIMKMKRTSSDTTYHIEGDTVDSGSESKREKEQEVQDEDDFIEEIVIPSRFLADSDDEAPKRKRKRRKPEPDTSKEGEKEKGKETDSKSKKTKDTENKKEGEQTTTGEEKPKKRRKKSGAVEVIDLEELQKKRAEGFTDETLQSEADLDKKKQRPKKDPKAKDTKEKVEEKDKPKKQTTKKTTSEEKKKKESTKDKKEKEANTSKDIFMDLDELDSNDDFEIMQVPKRQKGKEKESKKKKADSDDDDVVFRMPPPPSSAGSDMEIESKPEEEEEDSDSDLEVKQGEKLRYSSTLETFDAYGEDDEGETSDYEYSGVDLLDFEPDVQGTPVKSTPTQAANAGPTANPMPNNEDIDDGQVHSNEEALLYSVYKPKIDANVYCPHPANVVEAHTLASVTLPDCDYQPSLPKKCFTEGGLSSLQLETVAMVGMRHSHPIHHEGEHRAGYFIGDGTGVGKGRQIAAIFADNFLKGRKKGIWFSVSNTLSKDARRDLDDIGCGEADKNFIPLLEMPAKAAEPITKKGVLFATYSTLVSKGTKDKTQTRYDQIMKWCGDDFEGVIVFDEGHAAKNLQPGKSSSSSLTGQRVFDLQEQLPKARIVYVSATGATEPHHMAYMTRLGLWGLGTDFPDFKSFSKEITDAGVGAMEMVAMEMKGRGIYCSRYLSFEGTTFDILKHNLNTEEAAMYDKAVKVWDDILAIAVTNKSANKLVWAAHQRFFLSMILAIKIPDCVKLVKKEIERGNAVVIGLFSTGEALVGEEKEDSEELFSAPQQILLNLVEKITTDGNGKPIKDFVGHKEAFENDIKALRLPENPLDKLIDELGGVKKVAEMTGRRKRFVKKKSGYRLESRDAKEENLAERDRFQKGEKVIAVISDAASMGISLQSDLSCKNKRQRVHVILQLPWAADKAVQQLGRTHRSHQVTPPHYKLIITDLGGEWRLASTIAARLASLGALTNADRRAAAASKSLSKFLLQPKYVLDALRAVENELKGNPEAQDLFKKFMFMECNAGGNSQKTKRFLNRLLGFSIETQRNIFDLFMNQYERQVMQAQKEGRFDDGVYDLQGDLVSGPTTLYKNPMSENQVTESYVVAIDRGVRWKKAVQLLRDADKTKQGTTKVEAGLRNGFYQHRVSGMVVLAIQRLDSKHYFHICKPHLGHQRGYMTRSDLGKDYKLIPVKTAKRLWENKYEDADGEGKGQRMVLQHVIVGSILPIFSRLVMSLDGDKIQIVRAKCGDKRLVGVHVHQDYVTGLLHNLATLENEVRASMRKHELLNFIASQGMIVKERLEALPVKSLASYLGLGLQQHGGPRRKRKQQIEEYKDELPGEMELQQAKQHFNSALSSATTKLPEIKIEDVARDVMAYLSEKASRSMALASAIEASGVPELPFFSPHLCTTYVNNGGTTTASVIATLMAIYQAHAPRLEFLKRILSNAPLGIHYVKVQEIFKIEFPKSTSNDLVATLTLPTSITHVQYINMDTLIWRH